MDRIVRITALAGFVVLTAASAHAQGWYNYAVPNGLDPASGPSSPNYNSYSGLYVSPGGELYSGSVNTFSVNLGSGVSMSLFSSVSNGPADELSGLSGSTLVPGFASTVTTNYANGLYLDPAVRMPSNVSGRLSVNLGGGLSMDFLGALSRGPANGFYFGPGSGFDNRISSTVGTGFSMNFGHGGTLSVIGGVSRGFGAGFP